VWFEKVQEIPGKETVKKLGNFPGFYSMFTGKSFAGDPGNVDFFQEKTYPQAIPVKEFKYQYPIL
jgi:hypothetical protein